MTVTFSSLYSGDIFVSNVGGYRSVDCSTLTVELALIDCDVIIAASLTIVIEIHDLDSG